MVVLQGYSCNYSDELVRTMEAETEEKMQAQAELAAVKDSLSDADAALLELGVSLDG